MLDLSDLIDGGYYLPSDPISEFAREEIGARDREALHVIVLTEGSTDTFVLDAAFKTLRPELSEFVSFMDFAESNVQGGASFLANMVRSFIAAGIRDRIVAIFDNDTAGCLSQNILLKQKIPGNIRVMRYPDIDVAEKYPTLGPSGLTTMNVNGSAAGIELYLGHDVISDDHGKLIPIQWKGYEPTLKRYQGEILDKRGCIERFTRKVRCAKQNGGAPASGNWSELGAIVNLICTAFATADAEFMIDAASSERD